MSKAWEVVKGYFILPSGNAMKASCRHQKRGACGGCYARLWVAFEEVEAGADPKAVARKLAEADKAELR